MTTPTQLREELEAFEPTRQSIDIAAIRSRARRSQMQRRTFGVLAALGVAGVAVGAATAFDGGEPRTADDLGLVEIRGRSIIAFLTAGNAGSGGGVPPSFAFDRRSGGYVELPDGYLPMAVNGRYVLAGKDHEPLGEVSHRYDLRSRTAVRLRNAGMASPDGTKVLTIDGRKNLVVTGFTITDGIANTVSHRESWVGHSFHGYSVRDIKWMPDSRSLLIDVGGRTLIVGLDGSIRRTLGLQWVVYPEAWSPDGKQVATWRQAGDGGVFLLVDVSSGRTVRTLPFGKRGGSLVWTPDDNFLFVDKSRNHKSDTYNGRTLDLPLTLDAYSPEGSRIHSYRLPRVSPLGFDSVVYQLVFAPLSR